MEKLGKAAAGALVRSGQNSAPAPTTRRQTVITPPARVDHFADVAIPNRVWSAFVPNDGSARQIVRALMDHERATVERRVATLVPALLPYDRTEKDRVAIALMGLYESYPSLQGKSETEAAARIDSAMESLADLPAWAIEESCLTIRRSGYRKEDGKLEQHWPPSDAEIHAIVDKLIDGRRIALIQAKALLAATLEPLAIERAVQTVKSSLVDFHERMGKATELDEADEKRRREVLDRGKERALEQRRQEYRDAGITPPPTRYGYLTSLPMMLKNGWRVQEVKGERVLVGPKKTEETA